MHLEDLPHACGGVSMFMFIPLSLNESSPRMWGCFSGEIAQACVLVNLPHACGGVSTMAHMTKEHKASSPRMWECFYGQRVYCVLTVIFPTHVGVFRYFMLPRNICIAKTVDTPYFFGYN